MVLKKVLAIAVVIAMIMSIMPAGAVAFAEEGGAVATIGGVEYTSLAEAMAAVDEMYDTDAIEVTLLKDSSEDFVLEYGVAVLNTNGNSYSGVATVGGVLITDCEIENVVCSVSGESRDGARFGYAGVDTGVETVEGAQVRIGGGKSEGGKVVGEDSGIRFVATANPSDTLAAIAYEFFDGEEGKYDEGYEIGIKLSAEGSSNTTYIPAILWQEEGKVFTAALTSLKETNFNRRYTARAYVTVEGVVFEDVKTSTRSIYQVASGLLSRGEGAEEMSEALVGILNAYVNQTGVRLTLTDAGNLDARLSDKAGGYTGDAFFTVGDTTYRNGKYFVTLEAIGRSIIDTRIFNEYIRINNNHSMVSPVTGIKDNGDGTYTITFDYADVEGKACVINEAISLASDKATAVLPVGVQFTGSADKLSLVINTISEDESTVKAGEGEEVESFDVHVTGITEGNVTPVIVSFGEVAEKGLNRDCLRVYHVEDGVIVEMEQVETASDLKKHNQFAYDPVDGSIVMALAGFGEVAIVTGPDKALEEKFETKFTGDFLYRVGNQNAVKLGSLFKAKEGATIDTVDVTVEAVDGTAASGTYTANETWTEGTIKFENTGIVKVTITDNDYCTPAVLYLEVVDAYNTTAKANATDKNVVLLNDISGEFKVANGYAFYGNGFTVNCSGDGSYRSPAISYGFVTVENGGVLDNVQIICDIFPEAHLYTTEVWNPDENGRYPYGYSAVVITGDSTISNCYIYGARNNIQVGEGNVTIENTVTECGSLSNVHIKSNESYTVTLDNLTTIQYRTTSKYDTSATVLGFGVIVGTNESASNPTIELFGDLRQYNWVNEDDRANVSNTTAVTAITEALKVEEYQHTIGGKTTINMGIVFLNELETTIDEHDFRENKGDVPYLKDEVIMVGKTGAVYSIAGSSITEAERYNATTDGVIPYNATTNRYVGPTVKLNEENTAVTAEWEFDAEWKSVVSVDLDKIAGGSHTFKFSDLNVVKYGKELEFEVRDSNGETVDKSEEIVLNQLFADEYTLLATDEMIYDANGDKVTGESVENEIPFVLKATKTSIEPPKFTNDGTATAIRLVNNKDGEWRPAYTALTGVSVTYWSASEGTVKTADLSTLYNSGTISSNVWTYTCDDYTLTVTGGAVHSDGTKITPVVANNTLYFASTNKAFSTGTTSRSIILTYVFTDKNDSTTWNRTESVKYSELSEYDYNSFKNDGTLTEPSEGSDTPCFTPETLITMADGSKKQVKDIKADEQILAWDMFTGEYAEKDIALLVNHGEGLYEVIHLGFSDGTDLNLVGYHGVFDYDLNKFVYITADNYEEYIGHRFVKQSLNGGYEVAVLEKGCVTKEVTSAYSITSAGTSNAFAEGMLTVAPPDDFYNWVEMGDKVRYDAQKFNADVEKYGLYTYEDFEDYVTYEQFVEWNGAYLKIPVEKGIFTFDYIIELIELYKEYMPG